MDFIISEAKILKHAKQEYQLKHDDHDIVQSHIIS